MNREIALLQLMLLPKFGDAKLRRLLIRLEEIGSTPEDIVAATDYNSSSVNLLPTDARQHFDAVRDNAERLAAELHEYSIHVLAMGLPDYPKRLLNILRDAAPPLLFARGNLGLIAQLTIAFAGSRHASEMGVDTARRAARALAAKNINVISGYAHGVDLAAHLGALEAGGSTILVLAEGILQFKPKGEISEFLNSERVLIISQFPPSLRWIAHNAMKRNSTIIGLSDAMLIVESGTEGGTRAAGEEALKIHHPLFVLQHESYTSDVSGNEQLITHGGRPVHINETGELDLTQIFQALTQGQNQDSPQQGPLWVRSD